jgi:CHAT domain
MDSTQFISLLRPSREGRSIVSCAIAPTGDVYATGDDRGEVHVQRLGQTDSLTFRLGESPVVGLRFTDAGRRVIAVTSEGTVSDLRGGGEIVELGRASAELVSAAVSQDGRMVATAGQGGAELWVLSVGTAHMVCQLGVPALSCDLSGRTAAIGLLDGRFGWLSRDGSFRPSARALPTPVTAVAMTSDAGRLVAASWDGSLVLWNSGREVTSTVRGEGSRPGTTCLAANWQTRILATGSADGIIDILAPSSAGESNHQLDRGEPVVCLTRRGRANEVVAVHPDGEVEVRSLKTGETVEPRRSAGAFGAENWVSSRLPERHFAPVSLTRIQAAPKTRIADRLDLEGLLGCAPEVPPFEELALKGVSQQDYAEIIAAVKADASMEAEAESRSRERVLNAGLSDDRGCMMDAAEPLVQGSVYDLLVQIGLPWPGRTSIVRGRSSFREDVFGDDEAGHRIQAVLVGEALTRSSVVGWMWVPRLHGGSFPIVDGRKQGSAGPVRLRFSAPLLPDGMADGRAFGRLNLYYENNLLQSASVNLAVVRELGVRPAEPSALRVDFALTGDFADVKERYAERRLSFGHDDLKRVHSVNVSVTMNSDPDGQGQRLIIKHDPALPPAAIVYNPQNADETLKQARTALFGCFRMSDDHGDVIPDSEGLGPGNGKSKEQFIADLRRMAWLGQVLRTIVVGSARPEAPSSGAPTPDQIEWRLSLAKSLRSGSVIQISRTEMVPEAFVFPWGLVYEHPSLSPTPATWRVCDVLQEWDENGVWQGKVLSACPHQEEDWHANDVLCPYGFWGLKHIIEQPLAALPSERDKTGAPGKLDATQLVVGIGATTDPKFGSAIASHLQSLQRALPGALILPTAGPADSWSELCEVVGGDPSPTMLYLLCHGGWDGHSLPLLGIGLPGGGSDAWFNPSQVDQWVELGVSKAWWKDGDHRALVFLNGCHTAELAPGQMLNFASAFGHAGAGAVIGTEVSMLVETAVDIGDRLIRKIANRPDGIPMGQAMREVRWEMAGKGNLLGLAYTPYGIADFSLY